MPNYGPDYGPEEFDIGDRVEFDAPWGGRLTGEVVRVYNTRTVYHVMVDGSRYEVTYADNPKKIS
jgi:hypothetical protein